MSRSPNTCWYNDWRGVNVAPLAAFAPALPVSVIIPCYQTPAETLARTLAALERQTYPRQLFEVVLVDDGGEPPLARPPAQLQVKLVRQERRGFGLARARNTGARAAAHDILLFLDSDVMPEAHWMAAHARWHHAVADALTVGFTTCVAVDGLPPEAIGRRAGSLRELCKGRAMDPPWIEGHMLRTNDLTSTDDDPFRAAGGGNFGIGSAFYRLVGRSNESFTRWGLEDTELAYRAYTYGGLLVPDREAFALHQGRWDQAKNARGNRRARAKAASLIAHRWLRGAESTRHHEVPTHVVTVDAASLPAERVRRSVANLLADRVRDLVVRVATAPSDQTQRKALAERFGSHPRVYVSDAAPLREFPTAAFHIALPGDAIFAQDLVFRLRVGLGDAVTAAAALGNGAEVSITRTWALHRARRSGRAPTDFGVARQLSAKKLMRPSAARAGGVAWPVCKRLAAVLRWQVAHPRWAAWAWLWWRMRRKTPKSVAC